MEQKEAWLRSRDLLFNFGTPFIYLQRQKLQTLNLVCGLTNASTIQKCKIRVYNERGLSHVTYFPLRH